MNLEVTKWSIFWISLHYNIVNGNRDTVHLKPKEECSGKPDLQFSYNYNTNGGLISCYTNQQTGPN